MDKEERALTLRVKPRGEEWQGMFWKGSCLGLSGCGAAGARGWMKLILWTGTTPRNIAVMP